jgi:hypothetical protein
MNTKDLWSEGGQVFFTGGRAWSVNSQLQTVCIGIEDDIRTALDNPNFEGPNPEINKIIRLDRQLARESNDNGRRFERTTKLRASKLKRTDNKRIRPVRNVRHKCTDIRQPEKAKKHALRAFKPQQQSFFIPEVLKWLTSLTRV